MLPSDCTPIQSNTRRSRAVLSVIALGLELVRKRLISFSHSDWHAALTRCGSVQIGFIFEGRPQDLTPCLRVSSLVPISPEAQRRDAPL